MSTTEPYFLDDRVVIPEYIKKMTSEERRAEIERLEKEAREKKEKNQRIVAAI